MKHEYWDLTTAEREDLLWQYEDYARFGGNLSLIFWYNRHIKAPNMLKQAKEKK